jgi:hypothetical protein
MVGDGFIFPGKVSLRQQLRQLGQTRQVRIILAYRMGGKEL